MEFHDVTLELNGPNTWRVWRDGEVLIERAQNPENEACLALHNAGIVGALRTKHKGSSHFALTMDITKTAEKLLSSREKSKAKSPVKAEVAA